MKCHETTGMTDQKTGNSPCKISFRSLFEYIRKNNIRLMKTGGISLGVLFLLFLLMMCISPKEKKHTLYAEILLEKQNENFFYPNGKQFSSTDVLTPLVLKSVYQDLGLEKEMSFNEFYSSLSIAQTDVREASLDSEFSQALDRKRLNIVDLKKIEDNYKKEKFGIDNSTLTLSLSGNTGKLSYAMRERILQVILKTWYDIYSKMNARSIPNIDLAERIKMFQNDFNGNGYLIPLERARVFSGELLTMCKLLNSILQGKNVYLPSGETLGDVSRRLNTLQKYEIDVYRQFVLTCPKMQFAFDRLFLKSNLDRTERELKQLSLEEKGIENALSIVSGKSTPAAAGKSRGKLQETGTHSAVLDIGFFHSVAELIRNDAVSAARKEYSRELMINCERSAVVQAEKIYFQRLLSMVDGKGPQSDETEITSRQMSQQIARMYQDLMLECRKIIQFRDIIMKKYLASRKFYSVYGGMCSSTEYSISLLRTGTGLFLLWVFCFGIFVLVDFVKYQCGEKKA